MELRVFVYKNSFLLNGGQSQDIKSDCHGNIINAWLACDELSVLVGWASGMAGWPRGGMNMFFNEFVLVTYT